MDYSFSRWRSRLFSSKRFIFIILSATGIRSMMVDAIPASLKRAIGAGIGLFIAFIGLKNAGIVAANEATFVTIGKITGRLCPARRYRHHPDQRARHQESALQQPAHRYSRYYAHRHSYGHHGNTRTGRCATLLVSPIFCQFDFSNVFSIDMVVIVFTLPLHRYV